MASNPTYTYIQYVGAEKRVKFISCTESINYELLIGVQQFLKLLCDTSCAS